MSAIDLVAGIDCGKHGLDVALFPSGDTLRDLNTPSGHGELIAWLGQRRVARIGLEASGGYERPVRDALRAAGGVVEVFDPARVRFYARATGHRAKTDLIDAAVIAAFTAAQAAPALAPVDPAREELAGLVKARRLLVEKRADLRRAHPTAPAVARIALEAAIAALAVTIADLDAAITRLLAEQPAVAETVQALQSAPGVGPVVAITLAALLPELGRISGERCPGRRRSLRPRQRPGAGASPHRGRTRRCPANALHGRGSRRHPDHRRDRHLL